MILFVICAVALLTLAIVIFLLPLYRQNNAEQPAAEQQNNLNKRLYYQRLKELDADEAQGVIVDKAGMTAELQLSLLTDTQTTVAETQRRSSSMLAYLGAVILLLVSVGTYFKVGGWQQLRYSEWVTQQLPQLREQAQSVSGPPLTTQQMNDLALGIRLALYAQPNNANDWMLFGDINIALNKANNSLQAFAQAYQLKPQDPYIQLIYGQMLMRSNDISDQTKGEQLLVTLLAKDSQNLQVMSTLAFNAFSRGDFHRAIELWQTMLPLIDDQRRIAIIQSSIERANTALQELNETP